VLRRPFELIRDRSQQLDDLSDRACRAVRRRLEQARQQTASVAAGKARDIDQAVAAARAAFPTRADKGAEARGEILERFAQRILDKKEQLSAVETADNGSLLIANLKRIVDRAAHNIAFFAKRARELGVHSDRSSRAACRQSSVVRESDFWIAPP
jgi:acyl-CoA reductase-like NAD-dependent aldehyde dehydrogenase